jgi:drug/metabolite transporter (DMT)-like permease
VPDPAVPAPDHAAAGLGRTASTELYPAFGIRPRASAVVGAALIAFSGIFFRFSGASPSTATVFRCGLALPFLWLLLRYEDGRVGPRLRRDRLLALAAGLFFAFDLLLWMRAVLEVGAGLATVLANLQVVIVALAGWLLLGERPSNRTIGAIPVVILGAACISGVFEDGAYGADPGLGVLFGLGAAVAYSGYLLLIRRGTRDGRVFGPLFDASFASGATALVIGLIVGDLVLMPAWPTTAWLLVVALTSQVAGYGLINVSLPRLPAAVTSLLLLSETPSPLQMVGVALVLGGLLVATAPIGRMRAAVSGRGGDAVAPSIGGE